MHMGKTELFTDGEAYERMMGRLVGETFLAWATPVYTAIESFGAPVPVRPNPAASRLEAMDGFWEMAGLEAIETRVIRIPVRIANFDDFWDSNTVPVGPQGKVIAGMSPSAREQLRTRLREQLPAAADGHILYESLANAVRGRVPEQTY